MSTHHAQQIARAIHLLRRNIKPKRYDKFTQVIQQRTNAVRVVLENIHDPQNGSACLRSGDGYGVQTFDIVESLDNFNPQDNIRDYNGAATGVEKWITLKRHALPLDCVNSLKEDNYVLIGSSLTERSLHLSEILKKISPNGQENNINRDTPEDLLEPVEFPKIALVFGNESRGLSKAMTGLCDYIFKIPMLGFAQSFNINATLAMSLATLDSQFVFRKPGYYPQGYKNLAHKETSKDLVNSEKLQDLLTKPEFSTADEIDIKALWPDQGIPSPFINHPLGLLERNELLFKWLMKSTPHANTICSRYSINIPIL